MLVKGVKGEGSVEIPSEASGLLSKPEEWCSHIDQTDSLWLLV